jgi:cytoskeletal protein RodZ
VGAQVERVSRRTRVADGSSERAQDFGRWFQQQRELRGISIWFVAARTKLPPERIRAIELSGAGLKPDGHGRGTTRALARAIGADPEEGVARLVRGAPGTAGRKRTRWIDSFRLVRSSMGMVLVLGLGALLLGVWLRNAETPQESPPLVYRPDYVQRLLGGGGS